MPEFVNPFSGVLAGCKLTKRELTRAIRLALSAEEEAVHLYEALADATDECLAKEGLQDIANEERVHVGEFQRLINILLPDEAKFLADGAEEVNETVEKLRRGEGESSVSECKEISTVGNMKE